MDEYSVRCIRRRAYHMTIVRKYPTGLVGIFVYSWAFVDGEVDGVSMTIRGGHWVLRSRSRTAGGYSETEDKVENRALLQEYLAFLSGHPREHFDVFWTSVHELSVPR